MRRRATTRLKTHTHTLTAQPPSIKKRHKTTAAFCHTSAYTQNCDIVKRVKVRLMPSLCQLFFARVTQALQAHTNQTKNNNKTRLCSSFELLRYFCVSCLAAAATLAPLSLLDACPLIKKHTRTTHNPPRQKKDVPVVVVPVRATHMCVPRGGDVSREEAGALAQKNQLASLFERSEPDTHALPPLKTNPARDLESASNIPSSSPPTAAAAP